jgi:deoxyribonuclease-4
MSIAGGVHKAVEAAARYGMDTVQIFTANARQWHKPLNSAAKANVLSDGLLTKNNNQWRAKPIGPEDVSLFAGALQQHKIGQPISHASYLINLASGNPELWEKSVDGMVVELQRAEQLGIAYVVVHPGAHTGQTEQQGVDTVIRAIDEVHRRADGIAAQLLLEATAGQGTCLGCRFEHLSAMITGAEQPQRLGICVDTCHLFAAGYPLSERSDYLRTFRELERIVGLDRIKAFHLNDSKKEFGSRVDRHAHIGRGKLGLAAFEHLLNDRRFRRVPMYLETPKETNDDGEEWDVVNLRTLRELIH